MEKKTKLVVGGTYVNRWSDQLVTITEISDLYVFYKNHETGNNHSHPIYFFEQVYIKNANN